MNKVKFILIGVAAIIMATSLYAQPKHSAKISKESCQQAPSDCKRLATTLQLSDAQVKQLEAINAKYAAQGQERKAKMKSLHEEMNSANAARKGEFEALLTPAQKAAFEQMKSKKEVARKACSADASGSKCAEMSKQCPKAKQCKKGNECPEAKQCPKAAGCDKACAKDCKANGKCDDCTKCCAKDVKK